MHASAHDGTLTAATQEAAEARAVDTALSLVVASKAKLAGDAAQIEIAAANAAAMAHAHRIHTTDHATLRALLPSSR